MNATNLNQEIILKNRKDLKISGVKKVNSLNKEKFDLDTILGNMIICGSELEMLSLDIDKGDIIIKGKIDIISYTDKTKSKKEGSFITKLFR